MSLMEFCDVRDGRLTPVYEETLFPSRCAWCEGSGESLLPFAAMRVCPTCFEKAETAWDRMRKFCKRHLPKETEEV
jgi:hypothetical protein